MLKSLRIGLLALVLFFAWPAAGECPQGDLTGDCLVDFDDVRALASQWLYPPDSDSEADLDGFGGVESRDFALLAERWSESGIPLVINEFVASNSNGATDPQLERDDWIEIYNAGDHTIELAGMYLTDDLEDPTKWQIPTGSALTRIGVGGHVVIWADEDVGDNPNGLHADFQLSIGGEEIGLFTESRIDGQIILVDSIEFSAQESDISYGRYPDGSKTWRWFTSPSPGWANTGGYADFVSEVEFSHERGFYDSAIHVTLACDSEGAAIYYTTNGEEPGVPSGRTVTGTFYTGPITIDKTTCLRAMARITGWKPTDVVTQTYVFIGDVKTQSSGGQAPGAEWPLPGRLNNQIIDYGMDPDVVNNYTYRDLIDDALLAIPSISIVTDLKNLFSVTTGIYVHPGNDGADWERPASVELINPDGSEDFQINCGLRIRGGYSRSTDNPKHAFRLFFGTEYGGKLEFPLFGDEGVDEFWNVDLRCSQNYSWSFNGSAENTAVREVFSRDLQGEMGHYYTRSRAYHLYLNGQYWGLFQTQERSEASYASSYMGGEKDDYDVMKVDTSGYVMWPTDGDNVAYRRLYDAAMAGFTNNTAYYRAQGMNPDGTINPSYERMLDVDDLIDFMIIEYYTGDRDGPGSRFVNRPNNTYCIYSRVNPDGWKSFQHDNEHTLGVSSSETNMVSPLTTAGSQFQYFNPHWLHERLAGQNADYRMRFADHVYKHFFNGGLLTPSVCQARISKRVAEIEMAIIAESARWGDAKQASPFTRDTHWRPEINDLLYNYIPPRTDVVLAQLKSAGWYPIINPPSLSKTDSHVSSAFDLVLSAPGNTIYYTDDGSDPRSPGGAVSSSAKLYIGPIHIAVSTIIKARAWTSSSVWSALREAAYAVGPVAENLRITEMMYHPLDWGDPEDPNREFIELTNIGSESINLNLVHFTNGIDFTFGNIELGPREYVLVVRNQAAFEAYYQGTSGIIAGEYSGRLDNGGEHVELADAAGQKILSFDYKDGWYDLTDGSGLSLTIRDPSNSVAYAWDNRLAAYWKLDDGSGTTATDSVGDSDGILHGNAAWTFGRINGAISFDGAGDYVSFSSLATLAGDNLTVQAWVRMNDSASFYVNPIVMQHTLLSEGYRLQVFEDRPTFSIMAVPRGITIRVESPDTITRNQWHHIAGTNNGSELKIYVDGEFKGSVSSSGYTGVEHEGYIGYDYAGVAYWNGLIDDVRVYDRALSEYELSAMSDSTERWNAKDSWRPSAYPLGSPGWDDSGIVPNPGDVVINEVLAHAHDWDMDWIELYNPTNAQIDIGNWYLSDSSSNLMKYRIASGTKINAKSYRVFYEHLTFGELSSDPGRIVPFALSENGDEVYLSSAQAGVLMGFRAVEDFGASERNISFGRYYKRSTDSFNFVPMEPSENNPNNYPKVGPIVISEIMYHPDWPVGGSYTNNRYEYVELHNITGQPVRLLDDTTGVAWAFSEGIGYSFPAEPDDVTIAGGDYVVVVRDINAFMWRYPSVPAEKVFGPYEGKLSNSADCVEISKPGDRDQFGRQHYIRVDRVSYSDGSHPDDEPGSVDLWPVDADGHGRSLTRVAPNLYGNDPNNWTGSDPSPGQ
ncbi:MAG: lamin tail domain-containing protein [Sedimentisphaerales bacterium]|nr:lamin tail domain-containing protein [Sedimentisphaerales bacterium]